MKVKELRDWLTTFEPGMDIMIEDCHAETPGCVTDLNMKGIVPIVGNDSIIKTALLLSHKNIDRSFKFDKEVGAWKEVK